MTYKKLAFVLAAGVVLGGYATAWHDDHGYGSIKAVAAWNVSEKVDGKESTATAVEVTLEARQEGEVHRHPGPVLGYVLEGKYEWAIDDQPPKVLEVGEAFYEPSGCLHRVSRNPGEVKTRVLAWVLHPREVKDLVLPALNK